MCTVINGLYLCVRPLFILADNVLYKLPLIYLLITIGRKLGVRVLLKEDSRRQGLCRQPCEYWMTLSTSSAPANNELNSYILAYYLRQL